jgi:hypothetical protein
MLLTPNSGSNGKLQKSASPFDATHVKYDYCGGIVSLVRPSKDGKKAMCNECVTRLTSRQRVFVLQSDPLIFSSDSKAEVIRRHSPLDAPLKSLLTLSALSGLRLSLSLLRYPAIA